MGTMLAGVCATGAALLMNARFAIADAPPGRYAIAAGEVTDTLTGLVWQQGATAGEGVTWAGATTYCNTLNLNNHAWRVPTLRELQTLVDDSKTPAIDLTAFPTTPTHWSFWTSNAFTGPTATDNAWVVDFTYGFTFGYGIDVSSSGFVRCVR
jgi:hypothetical protein